MGQEMIAHQVSLENAFWWVEFPYREGNAMIEALRGRLSEGGFPSTCLSALCLEQRKKSYNRYVWLDCSWYLPNDNEDRTKAAFVALSYASEERRGSHVIVGVAELDEGAGLLRKPKSEDRHWLLDEALDGSDYPGAFRTSVGEHDGLIEHVPPQDPEALPPGAEEDPERIVPRRMDRSGGATDRDRGWVPRSLRQ